MSLQGRHPTHATAAQLVQEAHGVGRVRQRGQAGVVQRGDGAAGPARPATPAARVPPSLGIRRLAVEVAHRATAHEISVEGARARLSVPAGTHGRRGAVLRQKGATAGVKGQRICWKRSMGWRTGSSVVIGRPDPRVQLALQRQARHLAREPHAGRAGSKGPGSMRGGLDARVFGMLMPARSVLVRWRASSSH